MIVLARIRSAFLLVIVGGTLLVGQSFSVADVLSAPFPSNLVSTTDGEMLAWIFNQEGKRNIWIAEGTDFKVRRLTNYLDDDGQEMGGLVISPDGEKIVYVRGGAANRDGEHPNPSSGIDVVEQEVWCIEIISKKKMAFGGRIQS